MIHLGEIESKLRRCIILSKEHLVYFFLFILIFIREKSSEVITESMFNRAESEYENNTAE
ncbi:MAG: hypothetical protein A2Y33_14520 [Spirochaetes bacterium GWF1_51_8]|nr:MAG: hypothetical protein A2Y33_14520 [Spirochaetes bacterium GWF1_51_8]